MPLPLGQARSLWRAGMRDVGQQGGAASVWSWLGEWGGRNTPTGHRTMSLCSSRHWAQRIQIHEDSESQPPDLSLEGPNPDCHQPSSHASFGSLAQVLPH